MPLNFPFNQVYFRHMNKTVRNKNRNIDSVVKKKEPQKKPEQKKSPSVIRIHTISKRKKNVLSKQLAWVVATFVITFVATITTSRLIAAGRLTNPFFPAEELQVQSSPSVLASNDPVLKVTEQPVYLPAEVLTSPDPLAKRKEFLQEYLKSKNSVLANHVEAISEQSQWKLIVAIARAESSFCRRHAGNNCWGIGGAWNLKKYPSYDAAIADVNRILEQHYISIGLDSPKEIEKKWVGHQNSDWEAAVQQELDNLKNID